MKRLAFYGTIVLVLAALIIAGWRGATWLFGTPEGARWVVESVSRHTPVKISARKIAGSLLDHLRLEDVQLTLQPFEAELRSLDYRLEPLRLLAGVASLETLTVTGLRITDNSPKKQKPDLSWPKISVIMSALGVSIKRLDIADISYFSPVQDLELKDISLQGSVRWRYSKLTISDLALQSPAGSVAGEIAAGFYQPDLRFDLRFMTPGRPAALDGFSVSGRFKPGLRPEQIAGHVAISGTAAGARLLELAGDVGMTSESFNIRNLRLGRDGRQGTLTGGGSVLLTAGEPLLSFQLLLKDVDLASEIRLPTKIAGSITLNGTPTRYRGVFALENNKEGWQKAKVAGGYRGNEKALQIDDLTASLLAGTARGAVSIDWQRGLYLKGRLHGENINPANFNTDWTGIVNFDLAGDGKWAEDGRFRGEMSGRLLESRLYNRLLTGEVKAQFSDNTINFEKLTLQGRGFALKASGALAQKLVFDARIDDLGRFVSGAAGEFNFSGLARFSDQRLSGSATGRGKKIRIDEATIEEAHLDGFIGREKESPLRISAALKDIAYKEFRVDSASVKMDGATADHAITVAIRKGKAEMLASLSGGVREKLWKGKIDRFSGHDEVGTLELLQPVVVSASPEKLAVAPLVLTGMGQERLQINGELTREPTGGFFAANWMGLDSKRLQYLLPKEIQCGGLITGKMEGKILPGGHAAITGQTSLSAGMLKWRQKTEAVDLLIPAAEFSWSVREREGGPPTLRLAGRADAKGNVSIGGSRFMARQGTVRFDGNEQGVSLSAEISPEGGGLVTAGFSSAAPLSFSWPQGGDVRARWEDVNAGILGFLLPDTTNIAGRLTGKANGKLIAGRRFSLSGDALLSPPAGAGECQIGYQRKDGQMKANLRSVFLSWDWQEKTLNGNLSAELVEYGHLQGSFRLPVSANLPVVFDKKGPLIASLNGKLKENGLLTFLLPGLIKESHGEIDANVAVAGSWENPQLNGRVKMARAGAFLPFAGIDVKDVQLVLTLENNLARVESFNARSGVGRINGNALVRIAGGRVSHYEGVLGGEDFQLVYTPELQVRVAPRLTFSGTQEKLTLRGEVKLTELLIYGPPAGNFVAPSSDVVREDKPAKGGKTLTPVFDAKVRLTLGDRSLVKMEGIDAKLAGSIDLEFRNLDSIASRGEIRVVEGSYKAYGVALQITRGRLFYAGGPIHQPSLDIIALRTIEDVKAGVTIGGLLRTPVIKLYSEPAMSDVDILSYVVFGHSLSTGSTAEQVGVLAQAASLLLSRGKAMGIQDKLKKQFGLSTLDIQSKNSGPGGNIGYKKINGKLVPNGTTAGPTNDVPDTLVAVGKYLTPQLYLSYGRSLFSGSNIFSLRYSIGKQWQIETVTGTESGVDLYYKIDFK